MSIKSELEAYILEYREGGTPYPGILLDKILSWIADEAPTQGITYGDLSAMSPLDFNYSTGAFSIWTNSSNGAVQLTELAEIPALDAHLVTGITQSQIAGLTVDDVATFKALKINADNTGLIYKGASLFIHDFTPAGTAYRNTFIGRNAGNQNIVHETGNQGWYNTGIGDSVLKSLNKGYQNVGIGTLALENLTDGYYNNHIGYFSGHGITTGSNNNSMGNTSLALNQTGMFNCAMGQGALNGVVLGGGTAINYNVAVGGTANFKAGSSRATSLGFSAGYSAQANDTLFLGNRAGYYETAANTLIIDTLTRTNEADQRAKALIYGLFAATTNSQYLYLNGNVIVSDTLKSQSYIAADGSVGVSGSFTTADSKTVTVKNGIITGIV